ncbi:hypothetical protein FRC18_003672, partial [Serendipita sp. 400]
MRLKNRMGRRRRRNKRLRCNPPSNSTEEVLSLSLSFSTHTQPTPLLFSFPSFLMFSAIDLDPGGCFAGHVNHSFFWKILAPASSGGGQLADGPLKAAIEKDFGSVDAFKKQFNATTAAIQGSGWGWL